MKVEVHAVPVEKNGHKYLRIESPVRVAYPVNGGTVWADVLALWDTGATNTCIPMKVAVAMGIQLEEPASLKRIKSVEQSRRCQFYLQFPDGSMTFVKEALAVPKMQSQFVIGMDVMSRGEVNIKPDSNGGVHFTFELPE
jgi:hypothetical protein